MDFSAARAEMVEHQLRRRGITDERVRGSGAKAGKIDTLSVQTRVALRNTLRP